jgi:hypothetical protein
MTNNNCPRWCDDHDGFDDGSADWHKSQEFVVAGCTAFLTDGTLDKGISVAIEVNANEGQLTIKDARRLALRLLELVDRATLASPAAVQTMRLVALSADRDLEPLAEEAGVDLSEATIADLTTLGRVLGRAMGLTSVAVH